VNAFIDARRETEKAPLRNAAIVKPHGLPVKGKPFSVTVEALVDARFPPIMGWRRHNDSHFLRALCAKQHPGVSKDCLVRLVMLHRHDDIPLP